MNSRLGKLSMFAVLRVCRKELVAITRDGRLKTLALLLFSLLCAALLSGWQTRRDLDAERRAAEHVDAESYRSQGARNPHDAAHFGQTAFKPLGPLALFDPGLVSYVGSAVWLEAHRMNLAEYRPAEDAGENHRFGSLCAAWLLQWIAPPFVILLAYHAFAGERERGTLRLLLGLGVSPRELLAGKLLALTVTLGALLIPAMGLASLLLFLQEGTEDLSDIPARSLVLCVGYGLYLCTVAGIAIAVSLQSASARSALIALLGYWLITTLVLPRVATELAELAFPTPGNAEFHAALERDLREGLNGHDPFEASARALEARLLERYGVRRTEDLPVSFAGVLLQAGEERGYRVFENHYRALWARYDAQERIHRVLSLVSPMIAIRSLSMAVAGTDRFHHEHFVLAAEAHRRRIVGMLNRYLIEHGAGQDFNYIAGEALWAEIPRFEYRPPSLRQVLARHYPELLILFAWAASVWWLAWRYSRSPRPM